MLAGEKKNSAVMQELPMSLASSRITSLKELKKELLSKEGRYTTKAKTAY